MESIDFGGISGFWKWFDRTYIMAQIICASFHHRWQSIRFSSGWSSEAEYVRLSQHKPVISYVIWCFMTQPFLSLFWYTTMDDAENWISSSPSCWKRNDTGWICNSDYGGRGNDECRSCGCRGVVISFLSSAQRPYSATQCKKWLKTQRVTAYCRQCYDSNLLP